MDLSKLFIVLGIVFILIGLFMSFSNYFPLGKLPGDITITKGNFTFHFPIVTSIVLSIVLSLLFWLLTR